MYLSGLVRMCVCETRKSSSGNLTEIDSSTSLFGGGFFAFTSFEWRRFGNREVVVKGVSVLVRGFLAVSSG